MSARGALVECDMSVSPGTTMAIDIIGVGPVVGIVRWAQAGKFGVLFSEDFDLSRLAPKGEKQSHQAMLSPWHAALPRDRAAG